MRPRNKLSEFVARYGCWTAEQERMAEEVARRIEADGLERTVLVLRIALHLLDLGSQVASEDGRHGRRLALPRSAARERAADADDLRESADG